MDLVLRIELLLELLVELMDLVLLGGGKVLGVMAANCAPLYLKPSTAFGSTWHSTSCEDWWKQN